MTMNNCLGALAYAQGDAPWPAGFLKKAWRRTGAGNQYLAAGLLHNLGSVALDQGDLRPRRSARRRASRSGRPWGSRKSRPLPLPASVRWRSIAATMPRPTPRFRACLTIRRALGDKVQIAELLVDIGLVAQRCGKAQQARTCLTEGLALALETGVRRDTAMGLVGLGLVEAAQGRALRAVRLLGAATALLQALGRPIAVQVEADYTQTLADVRAQVPAGVFAPAWAAGQALTVAQATAEALAPPAAMTPRPPRANTGPPAPPRLRSADAGARLDFTTGERRTLRCGAAAAPYEAPTGRRVSAAPQAAAGCASGSSSRRGGCGSGTRAHPRPTRW